MARKKAKAAKPAKSKEDDLPIEEAMTDLSSVVSALEGGQESLEDSLKLFERGMGLLRVCNKQLDSASRRIEVITKLTEEGDVESAEFDATASSDKQQSGSGGGELF